MMLMAKKREGATLIELIVAMALFSVLITIAVTAFIQALKSQRAIVALMAANDNASLMLEQMAREIRVGYSFQVVGGDGVEGDELQFVNAYNEIVSYKLNRANHSIERGIGGLSGYSYDRITGQNVRIDDLRFRMEGGALGDGRSPRITVNLGVGAKGSNVETISVRIQTTVSARLIDS